MFFLLLQIFVTRGGNKKYASVLAPGQLGGLKYDVLIYPSHCGHHNLVFHVYLIYIVLCLVFFPKIDITLECSLHFSQLRIYVQVMLYYSFIIFVIFISISICKKDMTFSNVPPLCFIFLRVNTFRFSTD